MVAVARRMPGRMSVPEFLDWSARNAGRWQLIDGEPHAMAPPSRTHGSIQSQLARLIGNHLWEHAPACAAVTDAGVVPRVLADINVRVPDLAVTCSPYDTEEAVLSDPVLIVEILSPSNQADTWANVWAYTSIPSVLEILVLRSDAIGGELLRRDAAGAWPERPIALDEQARLVLDSIGFSASLADAYATTRLARR